MPGGVSNNYYFYAEFCKDSLQLKLCHEKLTIPVTLKQIPSKYQRSQHSWLVWDGILRYHFIFSPILFFATLPHRISLVLACPSVGIQFPAHSPLPIYSSRRSDLSPHSKRQWSPPWRMCSQSYWLPLFLAHQCALSQLWLASSAKTQALWKREGAGTPWLKQRVRLSNIDWVFIFVFFFLPC